MKMNWTYMLGIMTVLSPFIVGFAVAAASSPAQESAAPEFTLETRTIDDTNGWHRGVTIRPMTATDLGSDAMRRSLENLRKTGATHVAFVVPYYQQDLSSSSMVPGLNTPTDEDLSSAIKAAHALGLRTALKVHIETPNLEWRAHIDPTDRELWFKQYGDHLVRLGAISEDLGVEMITLGTELVNLSTAEAHPDNTRHWIELIEKVRGVYSGKLTYSANSTNNNNDRFVNEKEFIEFWSHLDYAGLSVYYKLDTASSSVESLMAAWDHWNTNDLQDFAQRIDMPIIFTEIGYRSITGVRRDPWSWDREGVPDEEEQANAYEALLTYWEGSDIVDGVYFWHWEADPYTGGSGTTSYTPQNKKAEEVLRELWGR